MTKWNFEFRTQNVDIMSPNIRYSRFPHTKYRRHLSEDIKCEKCGEDFPRDFIVIVLNNCKSDVIRVEKG